MKFVIFAQTEEEKNYRQTADRRAAKLADKRPSSPKRPGSRRGFDQVGPFPARTEETGSFARRA